MGKWRKGRDLTRHLAKKWHGWLTSLPQQYASKDRRGGPASDQGRWQGTTGPKILTALSLHTTSRNLPLVSREWKNGRNSSYHCTPFLHSLPTKGKVKATEISKLPESARRASLCWKFFSWTLDPHPLSPKSEACNPIGFRV